MGAAAGLIPMALQAAGGLLGGSAAGTGNMQTWKIGDVSDVQNANPMTGNAWNRMLANLGQYSPTQNVGSLQGVTPGIQSIVGSLISPYGTSLTNTANITAQQNARNVANLFSNSNAINSGAGLSAISRGMAEPISQAITNIAGMQSQLGGNLAQNLLGQMGNAYQGAFQGMSQYGAPEWWQPTYQTQYQPSFLETLGGVLGGLGGSSGGLLSMLGTGGSGK